MFRQTADRIIAAVDFECRWFDGSVIGLVPGEKSSYDIVYILCLFNSSFFRWYYQKLVNEEGRVFAQVKLSKLKQMPIRLIDFYKNDEIFFHDILVNKGIEIIQAATLAFNSGHSEHKAKVKKLEKEVDIIIYKLYNLTYTVACIVEGNTDWMSKEDYEQFKIE